MRYHLPLANPTALIAAVLLLSMLSGCLDLSKIDLKSKLPSLKSVKTKDISFVAAQFKDTCLRVKGDVLSLRDTVPWQGWSDADDIQLVTGELKRLRKIVLSIPGGGGHFSQTQTIHFKEDEGRIYFLSLEERFATKAKSGTYCAIYSEASDYLKTCSDVGKLIKKQPNRNEKYPNGGAHFIGWKTSFSGKRARVSCERTTKTGTLPYKGFVLSVSVEETTKKNN